VGAVEESLNAQGIVVDADVGGVGAAGGDQAEIARVEKFATEHAAKPGFAFAFAVGATECAEAGFGWIAAVGGSQDIVAA
jgi:hypothetical protein